MSNLAKTEESPPDVVTRKDVDVQVREEDLMALTPVHLEEPQTGKLSAHVVNFSSIALALSGIKRNIVHFRSLVHTASPEALTGKWVTDNFEALEREVQLLEGDARRMAHPTESAAPTIRKSSPTEEKLPRTGTSRGFSSLLSTRPVKKFTAAIA